MHNYIPPAVGWRQCLTTASKRINGASSNIIKQLTGLGFAMIFLTIISLMFPVLAHATIVTCGGVDDTFTIQTAINTGYVQMVQQNCVATNLTQTVDNTIYDLGKSTIHMKSGATGYLLNTGVFTATITNATLTGDDPLSFSGPTDPNDKRFWTAEPTTNLRSGLMIAPQTQSSLINVQVDSFNDRCIDTAPQTVGDPTLNFDVHIGMAALRARNCWMGLDIETARAGEYTTWNDVSMASNTWAMAIRAGNVNVGTITASNNGNGIYLDGTQIANNGHGNIGNAIVNHSVGYALEADAIGVGFTIRGNFHLGNIYLKNSTGVSITQSILQVGEMDFEGGGVNAITDNFMFVNIPGGLPDTVNHNYNGSPDETIVMRNYAQTAPFADSIGTGLSSWPTGNITPNEVAFTPNFTCGSGATLSSAGASVSGSGSYRLNADGALYVQYSVVVTNYGSCGGGISASLPAFVSSVPRIMQIEGKETAVNGHDIVGYVVGNIVNFNDYNNTMGTGWHFTAWGVVDLN